jgi:hypothetical protein
MSQNIPIMPNQTLMPDINKSPKSIEIYLKKELLLFYNNLFRLAL